MSREERMARAGDYVLGLMDEAGRERAERDMAVDPEFRECVALLAEQFHAFDREAEPLPVADEIWQTISGRIADLPQMDAREALEIRMRQAGLDTGPRGRHGFLGLRRPSAAGWGGARGVLLAACLIGAAGVGYLVGLAGGTAPEPVVVVILSDEADAPGAFVEAYGDDSVRIVPLADFDVPQGKTLEVWTLYDTDVGPVSLGTFERPRDITLRGPDQPVPQPQQLYEITLEDAPGSPIGRPTGPILVKGLAVRPPR